MNIASERARRAHQASQPTFAELSTPKLVTVLREGYRLSNFREDVQAGLTVAIVALPLSMAIAIGSGVTPDRGLYTAIVGGFLVSALGGSRLQVGGPAGAFIVLGGAKRRTPPHRRCSPRDHDGRHGSDPCGLSSARYLHQIYSPIR
jgi:SulP family sulfate permease